MNERDIFIAALHQRDPAERAVLLHRNCAGDQSLRDRIEELLREQEQLGSFLERPAEGAGETGVYSPLAGEDAAGLSERPGTVIGPYKLLEQIGEGGFGVVFMAEQTQPIRRKVALKVLKPGMDTRQVVIRFEAERQALALMDHPHIAHVLDGGETTTGRPYFVMELVRGIPITDFCDQNRLSIRERLELFVNVCQAVQHAHQKGIIHRDIKPSNVLVTLHDGTPVVKVIDFGIAKATGQQLTDKTLFTHFAQMIGTPLYMSPEQAGMSGLDVDTRSDIYSLGVLLYELLTGTTPFDRERLREADYDEIRRIIREEEPAKPSTRISTMGQAATTISTQRQSDPKRISQLLRGELDWITMKALEKDRNRRYETANGFALDIQRYLADEPVLACPPRASYRLRKFVRRNKTALAITGLILFFLVVLVGGGGWVVRDRAARQSQAAKDMEAALDRAELLLREGKRADALAAFERAELLAGNAAMGRDLSERLAGLKARLDAEARDQEFIAQFQEIRLRRQSRYQEDAHGVSLEAAFPEILEALRRYGLEIGVTPAEQAAVRVQGRPEPARRQLIAALDECLSHAPAELARDAPARQWLLATLNAADNDPWRLRVRKALFDRDWRTLEPLARAAEMGKQPPSFLLLVARSLPAASKASRLEFFRAIQRSYPDDLWANLLLADELKSNRRPAQAIRYYTAALALLPESALIYNQRGIALKDAGELDEGIADHRHALALAPHDAKIRYNLGEVLAKNHQFKEAIAEFRAYLRQESGSAVIYYNLGYALQHNRQLDEAIVAYREAIRLKKEFAEAHFNLGQTLGAKGHVIQAIREIREAVHLDPNNFLNHYGLGHALQHNGQLDEAIAAYREAIRLKPDYPLAHCDLGNSLVRKGEVRAALAELRRGHELGSKIPGWAYPSATWVKQCERLVELDGQLSGFLDGKTKPASPGERVELAWLCSLKRLTGAAARFYAEAFAAEPKLQAPHRYNAACAAALAGCGQGKDAGQLDAMARARLRRQALDWLRAELSALGRLLDDTAKRPQVVEVLRHWLADVDFTGVRGSEALAKLPEAERQPWQKLWDDVTDMLKLAQGKATSDKK